MKSRILMFILAFIVWCALTWMPSTQQLIAGAVVAFVVAAVMGSMFVNRPHMALHPMRWLRFLFVYIPVFAWELLKANLDVAYRVVHPGLPIRPGIVKIRTGLRSETGLTFLANSITLTPGTLTVDVDGEEGVLYVHWINVGERDVEAASRAIGGRFEPILMKIFEEDDGS